MHWSSFKKTYHTQRQTRKVNRDSNLSSLWNKQAFIVVVSVVGRILSPGKEVRRYPGSGHAWLSWQILASGSPCMCCQTFLGPACPCRSPTRMLCQTRHTSQEWTFLATSLQFCVWAICITLLGWRFDSPAFEETVLKCLSIIGDPGVPNFSEFLWLCLGGLWQFFVIQIPHHLSFDLCYS